MCVTRFTEPKNSQHFNVNKINTPYSQMKLEKTGA